MIPNTSLYRPSGKDNVIFGGFQEIIGLTAANDICKLLGKTPRSAMPSQRDLSLADIHLIKAELRQLYGSRGAEGLSLRAGRAAFRLWLKTSGEQTHLTDLEFRLLPTRTRLKRGMEQLAGILSEQSGTRIEVEEDEKRWMWKISSCPECSAQKGGECQCSFIVGFIQEYLAWASGGRFFAVQQLTHSSNGSRECLLQFNKQPID